MAKTSQNQTPRHPQERTRVLNGVLLPLRVALWLLGALLLSLVLEWIGLVFWWPEQGVSHSRQMLEAEIAYLHHDFRLSLVSSEPAQFAMRIADGVYHYGFELTGVAAGIQRLKAPAQPDDGWLLHHSRALFEPLFTFLIATLTIVQVFALRLAVLTLASPLFLLAALVGLTDGLVERDRRKYGGGDTKGYLYHHAKQFVVPTLVGAWVVYLSLPVSVHPNGVILPFAVLFGLTLGVLAGTFKKTL